MRFQLTSVLAAVLLTAAPVWAANHVAKPENVAKAEQRMDGFKKRIDAGKANKSLTPDEANKMDAEFLAIGKMLADAKADGHVTSDELKAINQRQATFGKLIYQEKHDTEGRQTSVKPDHPMK